jgi:hypothetical protein
VNAKPLLGEVARELHRLHLDVVLIGNAAAALQAKRRRDLAVLDILEKTREEADRVKTKAGGR